MANGVKDRFNIVCIGSGEMFRYCVRAILEDSANVVTAIFTWTEKPARRFARYLPLDDFGEEMNIPIIKVETMNSSEAVQKLRELKPDLVFVDGWTEKLSPAVLETAPDKFVCIHPSLLPKWRGGATLNWALIYGQKEWGISLFYMSDKIDQGDIIAQEPLTLESRDDIRTAFDKVTVAAIDLLRKMMPLLRTGKAPRRPQIHADAILYPRRKPFQGIIDWTRSNAEIANLVRALAKPYPGAFFYLNGKMVYVWKSSFENQSIQSRQSFFASSANLVGQIELITPEKGMRVICGGGSKIWIERVQSEGEPVMWADNWCKRHKIKEGYILKNGLQDSYAIPPSLPAKNGLQLPEEVAIAPSAIIDPTARIGKGTKIWAFTQVGEHAVIGENCVIGNGVYIDRFTKIGNSVRIHNKALIYHGVIIEDKVFIGPAACFTNDKYPKSGEIRDLSGKSWVVREGASIGANAVILPDLNIGKHAIVGAHSIVTKEVPDYGVVCGNPARLIGFACSCGNVIKRKTGATKNTGKCSRCGKPVAFLVEV